MLTVLSCQLQLFKDDRRNDLRATIQGDNAPDISSIHRKPSEAARGLTFKQFINLSLPSMLRRGVANTLTHQPHCHNDMSQF